MVSPFTVAATPGGPIRGFKDFGATGGLKGLGLNCTGGCAVTGIGGAGGGGGVFVAAGGCGGVLAGAGAAGALACGGVGAFCAVAD